MQLDDLNSYPHGGKSLQNLIDRAIGARFYPSPGSLHYHQLFLYQFHERTHVNFDRKKEKWDQKEENNQ